MIPARRTNLDQSPTQALDITSRLQRLRYEQRNHPQQLPPRQPTSPATAAAAFAGPSSLHPAFAALALESPPASAHQPAASSVPGGSASRYRGTAGPSAPASWLDGRRETDEERAGRAREAGRRAMVPLEEGDGWLVPRSRGAATLGEVCGRVIAVDLARGTKGSILLEYVKWLPVRLRLPLVELAPVKADVGLGQAALRELLSEEFDQEGESSGDMEGEDASLLAADPTPPPLQPTPPPPASVPTTDDQDWEAHAIPTTIPTGTITATLTSLNLSLCKLTHSSLAALLLTPAHGRPPARLVPTFPHLASLSLSASPRLTLSETLLDILSPLLSLRHLALACLPLADPLTPSTVLPRLTAATPTLESVDLSFVPGLSAAVLKNVNWDARWRELRMVGWRRWMVVLEGPERGKEAGRERKDEVARELWGVIRGARKAKGRFIKFVT